jgi:hypothetical protein
MSLDTHRVEAVGERRTRIMLGRTRKLVRREVMCPRDSPNCVGEVHRNPAADQHAGDMGHYPIPHTNRFYPPDDRAKALEIYREDVRIECIPCNRGGGNRNDGVV